MERSNWRRLGMIGALALAATSSGAVRFADASDSPQLTPIVFPGVSSSFVSINPCRAVDTRPTQPPPEKGSLGPGETRTFRLTSGQFNGLPCPLPTSANAVTANVTIANPTAASFLTLYPAQDLRPPTSNLNWTASSSPTANQVTVALSPDGKLSLYNSAGTVDVIIDVLGYYVPVTLHSLTTTDPIHLARSTQVLDMNPLGGGTFLVSYSLTITNDTVGADDVFRCSLRQKYGNLFHAARAVRLVNPGSNIATLAGEEKIELVGIDPAQIDSITLMCGHDSDIPGASFQVDSGATLTALPVN